jgi:hypothetical protein
MQHIIARSARSLALLVSLWLACAVQEAHAAAGKVLFVAGPVTLERGGSRPAQAGDALETGDIVATGERARAQLLMGDGARIALRAGTRFRIDEFALPSNVQRPGAVTAVAASGRSVATLLKGGFRTSTGAIGKSDPTAYEVRTPVGTLGIRGTDYTAVFCRDDCADAPGLPPGQPIPAGLYLAVDDGRIAFTGRGLSFELAAPGFAFVPLEEARYEELRDPPAFLRGDGQGPLDLAGAAGRVKPDGGGSFAEINNRRAPSEGSSATPDASGSAGEADAGTGSKTIPIDATTPLGRPADLTIPTPPPPVRNSIAAAVPPASNQAGLVATRIALASDMTTNAAGDLIRFPAATSGGALATYAIGTANVANAGSNAASGIRWARWTSGTATATTAAGTTNLDLALASLHMIFAPAYEVLPVLPVSGTASFVPAGGTNPTDTRGNVGTLGGAFLSADFTNRTVTATVTADIAGLNWFASGSGPIAAGSPLFGGSFGTVLVNGIVPGAGGFGGFFTAPTNNPAQLTGAGVSYTLNESLGQLGTVSGVLALVPGTGQAPPPPAPPRRAVAFAIGQLGTGNLDASALDTLPQVVTDANGNLTRFVGPYGRGAQATTATYDIGSATAAESGFDPGTGIRWGRWSGGQANITLASGGAANESLAQQSLHWVLGSPFGLSIALPQSGTASYAVVGSTSPTDTLGNVGALGALSLDADFTNRTVTSAVRFTIAGRTWYGSGAGSFAAGSLQFGGSFATTEIQGLAPANGSFSGFFSPASFGGASQSGAGLSYVLADPTSGLGTASGVAALRQVAQGVVVAPPARDNRDIAFAIADIGQRFLPPPTTVRNAAAEYTLDGQFNLTRFTGPTGAGNAQFSVPAASVVDTGYSTVAMLRWGRWSGGTLTVTGAQTVTVDLSQQSLHWIESADAANPPVMPIGGAASYVLVGGTSPTDNQGRTGALGGATLDADFTNQLVNHTLSVNMGIYTVQADGVGIMGAQLGLQPHQFGSDYRTVLFNFGGQPTPGAGSFQGFFTGPVSLAQPLPPGAALTYELLDPQTNTIVNGVAAFRRP